MESIYWLKQERAKPLYPDLIWSRPVNKKTAGKLLIVGGNLHGFSSVGQAYSEAVNTGIGTARVLLPNSLQKTVSKLMPEAYFADSTPSGSFAQTALGELQVQAGWADGVLIAGDLGHNSETAILLEKFAAKSSGQITLAKDSVDYFTKTPQIIRSRTNTTFVLTMAQIQLLAKNLHFDKAFKFDINLLNLVELLHEFTYAHKLNIVLKHLDTIFVAVSGQVSTTRTEYADEESWRVPTAARVAVWWLQNPTKTFEALSSVMID